MKSSPEFNPQDFGFTPDDTNTADHTSHAKEAGLLISLYQDKEANPTEQAKALHLLKTCAKCRQTFESYQRIATDLNAYFEAVPPPPPLPSFSRSTAGSRSSRNDLPYATGSFSDGRTRARLAPFALQLGMVAVTLLLIVGLIALVGRGVLDNPPATSLGGVINPASSPVPTTASAFTPTPTNTPVPTVTVLPTTAVANIVATKTATPPAPLPSATPTPTLAPETPAPVSVAPVPPTTQALTATPTVRLVPTNTPVPANTPVPVSPPSPTTAVNPTTIAPSNTPVQSVTTVVPVTITVPPDGVSASAPVTNTVAVPSVTPAVTPTLQPTNTPTVAPSSTPTLAPTNTLVPTVAITPTTVAPTNTPQAVSAVADGQIAYISKANGEVYLIKSDGTANMPLTASADRIRWQSLVWSNNGRNLAAVGLDNQTKTSNIYLLEAGKLPELVAEGFAPVWSPNDKLLAYLSSMRANGSGKPTVVTLSTNTVKVLVDDYSNLAPQWFDDGFRLLIGQDKIVDTSGKLVSEFDVFENSCAAASLSPNGNLLAVLEADGNTFRPLIYDLDLPVVRAKPLQRFDKITVRGSVGQGNRCGAYRVRWSQDSSFFFFYHREGGSFDTCLVGVKDSSYRCLANLYEPSFNSANTALVDLDPATGNVYAIPFGNRPSKFTIITQARDLPQWQPAIR